MAETPQGILTFEGDCPDCGERRVELPQPLPELGDDFDWRLRDYDGFRLFMLQELAVRFPERRRWNPADMEVVIVEVLAAVLDQLSDMLDRVSAAAYLETARRPESVRRLLKMIGYDAVRIALARGEITSPVTPTDPSEQEQLEALWLREPQLMDAARRAGPRAIHDRHRMVTLDDYAESLEEHPLVLRAHAWTAWTGSWNTLRVAVVGWDDNKLDQEGIAYPSETQELVNYFHEERDLPTPVWDPAPPPAIRTVLRPYLEAYRMTTQEVVLEDAVPVPISMAFSIQVAPNFLRSEVQRAVEEALGTGPQGFFAPGRLRFGEDLHLSNLVEVLMALDGLENVCVNRFKRLGSQFPDQVQAGRIVLEDLEIAVCDNDAAQPSRGHYRLTLHGGRNG